MGTIEFRYYVVIIILVNFGKTLAVEIDQLSMNL